MILVEYVFNANQVIHKPCSILAVKIHYLDENLLIIILPRNLWNPLILFLYL